MNQSKIGIKKMCDKEVATDLNKYFLSARDWYYSDLNRRLLKEYYLKH